MILLLLLNCLCICAVSAQNLSQSLTQSQTAPKKGKKSVSFINNLAIVTYCTCDNGKCHLYDFTNQLKDLYCQEHGCDHIIMTNQNTNFAPLSYESQAHFQVIEAALLVMESRLDYQFIFLTGGDQIITNMKKSPDEWIPSACHSDQFDIFFPVDYFSSVSGVSSGGLFRNTAWTRNFLREYIAYSKRGHYVISEQSAFNHLLLRSVLKSEYTETSLEPFKPGGACDMHIPDEYYKYKKEHYKDWWKRLLKSSKCFMGGFEKHYFNNTVTGDTTVLNRHSTGRRDTPICLFRGKGKSGKIYFEGESGENWNERGFLGSVKYKRFMVHIVGKKVDADLRKYYEIVRKNLPLSVQEKMRHHKTSVYETCVKPFDLKNEKLQS